MRENRPRVICLPEVPKHIIIIIIIINEFHRDASLTKLQGRWQLANSVGVDNMITESY